MRTLDDPRKRRAVLMWVSLVIFALRVIGQVEVVLSSPRWLPSVGAWESGLIPCAVLLPVQIALLAAMAVVAVDHSRPVGAMQVTNPATRRALCRFAAAYFLIMLLRLIITAALPPHTVGDRGLVPILAHWDLAGFVALALGAGVRSVCRT